MQKRKGRFPNFIYEYCDLNVGDKVLFPFFMNFYPESGKRNKKSLARYTSKIVNELVWEGVLGDISNQKKSSNPYGYYVVLKHENLLEWEDSSKRKLGKAGDKKRLTRLL